MGTAARTLPAITFQVVTTVPVSLDSAEMDLTAQVSSHDVVVVSKDMYASTAFVANKLLH